MQRKDQVKHSAANCPIVLLIDAVQDTETGGRGYCYPLQRQLGILFPLGLSYCTLFRIGRMSRNGALSSDLHLHMAI